MQLSVIIPTMNEEESIGQVIDSVRLALSGWDFEILVVDTNSKDRTREIAAEKGAVVIEEPRRGYGRAYKTGFERSQGEFIATLDADCTYPAEEIPALHKILIDQNLDFITTNRFARLEEGAMSAKHRLGNFALTFTSNLLFRVKIKDSQSGMWVFRREILDRLVLSDDGMPMSEEIKIEAFRKVRSLEVPITYRKRVGEVKLSSWKDGWKNMKFLFKKRFRRQR
ncbi:MAG TPA: glycosyltransferase family 2 protein [Methanomassiliicoccales archaeon]|nr:glycosyltransferase family 2 protein [Methanomassiliicoccales archaeon]HPR98476.1 glycosyltransferase family 2 protein [Methanomassiliicoccales archaeon]